MLKGNLCPEGAVLKVAGLKSRHFRGPARVFENEESCAAAIESQQILPGCVVVIRNEGPRGGPGMREMLGVTARIEIDAIQAMLDLKVSEVDLRERRAARRPAHPPVGGLLEKYAQSVRSASIGAVTHGGAVQWPQDPAGTS